MNYTANTIDWKVGDIVIHDADAKRMNMLMVVVGHADKGIMTIYLDQNERAHGFRGKTTCAIWFNPKEALHAPWRFEFFKREYKNAVMVLCSKEDYRLEREALILLARSNREDYQWCKEHNMPETAKRWRKKMRHAFALRKKLEPFVKRGAK